MIKLIEKNNTGQTTYFAIEAEVNNKKVEATLCSMYDENSGNQDYELTILNGELTEEETKELKNYLINN